MELVTAAEGINARTVLEAGNILFFPDGGFEIPAKLRLALVTATQDARSFHKNIAYKPNVDKVSGLDDAAEQERMRAAMSEYSTLALNFMRGILPEYAAEWKVDYASFRSIEERGRDLPLKKRNDLLHVDAFPTRPVFGNLILRCFTNVNPDQNREWVTGEPFALLAPKEAEKAGLAGFAAKSDNPRRATKLLSKLGVPVVDRSAYDSFMLHFHDWLKSNAKYQEETHKYKFDLPPGSTWLVFTDMVPHSVLSGRLALEQTVIVARKSLEDPSKAPSAILEALAGTSLIA